MFRFISTLVLGTFLVAQGANLALADQVRVSKKAVEQALDAKEADLNRARNMLAQGTRSDLPNGVVYRLPGAAGVVATLVSVGSAITMIKPYLNARKFEEGKADEVKPLRERLTALDAELAQLKAPAEEAQKQVDETTKKLEEAQTSEGAASKALEEGRANLAAVQKTIDENSAKAAQLADDNSELSKKLTADERKAQRAEAEGAITGAQALKVEKEKELATIQEKLTSAQADVKSLSETLNTAKAAVEDRTKLNEVQVAELGTEKGAKSEALAKLDAEIGKEYEPVRFRGKVAAIAAMIAVAGYGAQYWIERQYTVDLTEEEMMELQAEIDQLSFEIDALRKQLMSF